MKMLESFLIHYSRKSEHTLDSYERTIKNYYEFVSSVHNVDDEDSIIKHSDWSTLNLYVNHLLERKLNPYSINQKLSALKTYFNFLVLRRTIDENPMEYIERISTDSVEQNTDYLTEEEYKRLLTTIKTKLPNTKQDNFTLTSKRDVLLVGLMIQTGLRVSEILGLTVNQIDTENKKIKVLGKGKKLRTVVFTDDILTLLQDYTDVRNTLDIKDTEILFLSRNGKKLSRQNVNVNLKKYCERARIDKDIHPHCLRHTALTLMGESGLSVAKISAIAGHTDTKTTSRYLHVKTDDIEEYIPKLF